MTVTKIEVNDEIITIKPDLAECDCDSNGQATTKPTWGGPVRASRKGEGPGTEL